MENLTKFYTSLVTSTGVIVEKETGNCYRMVAGVRMPTTVNGKHLFIPNHAALKDGIAEGRIGFHPLSENALYGESEVLSAFRGWVMLKVSESLGGLVEGLLKITVKNKGQEGPSPDQLEVLAAIPDVDAKMQKLWKNIAEMCYPEEYEKRLISIYLKRGGEADGVTYNRSANVNMPWLDNALKRQLMGIKNVRKIDVNNLVALMNKIFPGLTDSWMIGSLNQTSPYTHALLKAYQALAEHINKVADIFGKEHLEDYDDIIIDLEWTKELDNLAKLKALAPPMEGNTGEPAKDVPVEENAVAMAPPNAPAYPPANSGRPTPPVNQPNVSPQPQQQSMPNNAINQTVVANNSDDGDSYSWSEVEQPPQQQYQQVAPPPPPQQYQQPPQQQYQQPQQYYQPQYQQPPQPQYQQPPAPPQPNYAGMSPGRAQALQRQYEQQQQYTYGQPPQTYGQPPQEQYHQPPQQTYGMPQQSYYPPQQQYPQPAPAPRQYWNQPGGYQAPNTDKYGRRY